MPPELIMLALVAAVIGLPILWVVAMYNSLVKLRQQCRESWSGIDTDLTVSRPPAE